MKEHVVLTPDESVEVSLRTIIDPEPMESGDPYMLVVLDAAASDDRNVSMTLRAGGFLEPLSVYGMARSVLATLAADTGVAADVVPRVRGAIRAELIEAGVAKDTGEDAPWVVRLLDRLVEQIGRAHV